MRLFITILCTLFSYQIAAEIYSWEDKNGVTHFSESKPEIAVDEMKTIDESKAAQLNIVDSNIDKKENVELLSVDANQADALLVEQ